MLLFWWDWKEILYYELLQPNQTINLDFYCKKLDEFKKYIEKKRPELVNRRGVVFHHDNARPHTSGISYNGILNLSERWKNS